MIYLLRFYLLTSRSVGMPGASGQVHPGFEERVNTRTLEACLREGDGRVHPFVFSILDLAGDFIFNFSFFPVEHRSIF